MSVFTVKIDSKYVLTGVLRRFQLAPVLARVNFIEVLLALLVVSVSGVFRSKSFSKQGNKSLIFKLNMEYAHLLG